MEEAGDADDIGEWNGRDVWVAEARMAMGEHDPIGVCCACRAGRMHKQRAKAQNAYGSCCCWIPSCQVSMEASSMGSVAPGSHRLFALLICPLARACKAQLHQHLVTCSVLLLKPSSSTCPFSFPLLSALLNLWTAVSEHPTVCLASYRM